MVTSLSVQNHAEHIALDIVSVPYPVILGLISYNTTTPLLTGLVAVSRSRVSVQTHHTLSLLSEKALVLPEFRLWLFLRNLDLLLLSV